MTPAARDAVPTVFFSGGRGAGALIERLLADRRVQVSIVINGYDDGASTGEVRRFLGDALGPSDFRKNAGRAARALATAADGLIELLDCRLPAPCPPDLAEQFADVIASGAGTDAATAIVAVSRRLDVADRAGVVRAVSAFEEERRRSGRPSCSATAPSATSSSRGVPPGRRDFNGAVGAYTALLGLPVG
jgi:hypothetical protein